MIAALVTWVVSLVVNAIIVTFMWTPYEHGRAVPCVGEHRKWAARCTLLALLGPALLLYLAISGMYWLWCAAFPPAPQDPAQVDAEREVDRLLKGGRP